MRGQGALETPGAAHVAPAPDTDAGLGMAWWNRISERERAQWLRVAGSAVPADAWAAFKAAGAAKEAPQQTRA
jgi:hypothetical protein